MEEEAIARISTQGYFAVGIVLTLQNCRNRTVPSDHTHELWCADYPGEFMWADRRYCYPLTISDFASRYLLSCAALTTTKETYAYSVFERTFQDFGLPQAIRTDNGIPFASGNALYGLSQLSVWWLWLGIHIERIRPGHPEQNGRHERLHLTLKNETTRPALPTTSCNNRPAWMTATTGNDRIRLLR